MLARSCASKKTSLKAALLDQRVVAGLGNIYVCEALFRAHLSPQALAATWQPRTASRPITRNAWSTRINAVLNQAIKAGGSSLRDHRQTSGELGYFQHPFQVYDREGEKCQTPGLQRHRQALHPERALDVLVSEMPEMRSSWPGLFRPSTPLIADLPKTRIPATRAGTTNEHSSRPIYFFGSGQTG